MTCVVTKGKFGIATHTRQMPVIYKPGRLGMDPSLTAIRRNQTF